MYIKRGSKMNSLELAYWGWFIMGVVIIVFSVVFLVVKVLGGIE